MGKVKWHGTLTLITLGPRWKSRYETLLKLGHLVGFQVNGSA